MWKYLAGAAGVGLLAFALWLGITRYGAAQYARGKAEMAAEVSAASLAGERAAAAAYERGVMQGQEAAQTFVQWREGPLRTVTERVNHEIIRYRDSPAGRAVCLDGDGVRAANQNISAIAATAFPADPGRSPDPLPAPEPDPVLSRWNGEPGRRAGPNDRDSGKSGRMRDEAPVADTSLAEIAT